LTFRFFIALPSVPLRVLGVRARVVSARKYLGKLQVVLLGDPVKRSPSVATTL
jgi:hypothetical protein